MEVRNENLETVILNYWFSIVNSDLMNYELESDNTVLQPLFIHEINLSKDIFNNINEEEIPSFTTNNLDNTRRDTIETAATWQTPTSELLTTFTLEEYFLPEDAIEDFVYLRDSSDFSPSDYLFSSEIATETYDLLTTPNNFEENSLTTSETTTKTYDRLNYAVSPENFAVSLNNEETEDTESTPETLEPNDTIANATDTGINGAGSYNLTAEIGDNAATGDLDVDLFAVTVNANSLLSVRVLIEEDLEEIVGDYWSAPEIRIFDSEGTDIRPYEWFFESYLSSESNLPVETSDIYYVGISSSSNWSYNPNVEGSGYSGYNDTGIYELSINVDNVDDVVLNEPNNTIVNAVDTGIALNVENVENESDRERYHIFNRIGDNLNLAAENDVDLFAITLDVGDFVYTTTSARGDLKTVLTVFDPEGAMVTQNDDIRRGSYSQIGFSAETEGTYYIGVSSEGNINYDPNVEESSTGGLTSGFYDLELEAVRGTGEIIEESNDTIFEATDIELDSEGNYVALTEIGNNPNIPARDDVDMYAISLNRGDRFSASIFGEYSGEVDPMMIFFNSACEVISLDDYQDDLELNIDVVAEADDTYYLGISSSGNFNYNPGVEGSGSGTSTGVYRLRVSVDNASVDTEINDTEVNDTIASAVETITSENAGYRSTGYRIFGDIGDNPNLAAEDDVDIYAFFAEANSSLYAKTETAIGGNNLDTALTLFDSEGTLLNQNDEAVLPDSNEDSIIEASISTTGTYYIGVSSNTNLDYDPNIEGSGTGSNSGFYDLYIGVSKN